MIREFSDPRTTGEAFTATAERGWWPGSPKDPNPTKNGVTQHTYDGWREDNELPQQGVQLMSAAEQSAIYDRYWLKANGDALAHRSGALAIAHFDTTFNGGGDHVLHMTLGLEQGTALDAAAYGLLDRELAGAGEDAMVASYMQNRLTYLQGLTHWLDWQRVWSKRENGLSALLGISWRVPVPEAP